MPIENVVNVALGSRDRFEECKQHACHGVMLGGVMLVGWLVGWH